jgi:two-component system NtrC family sensor kinase
MSPKRSSSTQPDDFPANLPENGTILHVLAKAVDGVIVTDSDSRILFINDAARKHFQLNDNAFLGELLLDVIRHPDLLALFTAEKRGTRYGEIELSSNVMLNTHVTVVEGLGHAILLQDITHLKELDKAKTELVSTISHDLRSPLTSILGYVELLDRTGDLTDQQRRFAENIEISVRSISAVLSDMLELSRIEAGMDSTLEPVHMEVIAQYTIEAFRAEMELKHHTLVTQIPERVAPVLGHAIRLRQVANNLMQNAIKYTPEGGEIGVTVYEDGGFVMLQVKDNGVGIPLADQPFIWNKFFRSESHADSHPGTGLGLSIVKGIVDAHAGRIWTESVVNKGTTFTVMLPLAEIFKYDE